MSRPKGRIFDTIRTFHLTTRDVRELRAAANYRGVSQAEFIRQALREALRIWHIERGQK